MQKVCSVVFRTLRSRGRGRRVARTSQNGPINWLRENIKFFSPFPRLWACKNLLRRPVSSEACSPFALGSVQFYRKCVDSGCLRNQCLTSEFIKTGTYLFLCDLLAEISFDGTKTLIFGQFKQQQITSLCLSLF